MKRPFIIAGLLLGLTGFLFWWFSPTQVLKRRTHNLLETLTLDAGASRSSRQLGVYSLNALLAPEVELSSATISEANGTFERSDIESAYTWLCNNARQSRFEAVRIESVNVAGDAGTVILTLNALVELSNYRPADGDYQVTLRWRQGEDHAWQLAAATWAESDQIK
jgi:hypothetical protein